MTVVQNQVSVDKALNDVFISVVQLIAGVRAGKSVGDLAAMELPAVIQLIGEVSSIPQDVKDSPQACINSIALGMSAIVGALLSPQAPVA